LVRRLISRLTGGVRTFLSDKYDLKKHPNYRLTADYDKKNTFTLEKYVKRKMRLKPEEEFEVLEVTEE
jgi:type IV secretion system protein VirD4